MVPIKCICTSTPYRRGVLYTTLYVKTSQWFSPCTPDSSTNKTYRHEITEILLKVMLNTRTYLYELDKQAEMRALCKIFVPVLQRVQMNFIISDIVRIVCLSFIILQCHQRKLSKKRRSKCSYKCFYCVLCEVRAFKNI